MKTPRLKAVAVLAAAGVLVTGSALAATPAATPVSAPPPTYDYDSADPGTQPPKDPAVLDPTYRSVRTYQVTIPVLVPTAQLQAILPTGYVALPSEDTATTSTLSMAFFLDQRFQLDGGETYGPVSAVLVSTSVRNDNHDGRTETVFPAFEASGEVAALDAAFGPGSARLADVSVGLQQSSGQTAFSFRIKDKASGLDLTAEATGPSATNGRSSYNPIVAPFRTLDGRRPNSAFRASSQSDAASVPTGKASVRLHATGNELRFPGGTLDVVGLGANVTFARNVEFVVDFE